MVHSYGQSEMIISICTLPLCVINIIQMYYSFCRMVVATTYVVSHLHDPKCTITLYLIADFTTQLHICVIYKYLLKIYNLRHYRLSLLSVYLSPLVQLCLRLARYLSLLHCNIIIHFGQTLSTASAVSMLQRVTQVTLLKNFRKMFLSGPK